MEATAEAQYESLLGSGEPAGSVPKYTGVGVGVVVVGVVVVGVVVVGVVVVGVVVVGVVVVGVVVVGVVVVSVGGVASVTGAVSSDFAVLDPASLLAVTRRRMDELRSSETSAYAGPVAPSMFSQLQRHQLHQSDWLQRRH